MVKRRFVPPTAIACSRAVSPAAPAILKMSGA